MEQISKRKKSVRQIKLESLKKETSLENIKTELQIAISNSDEKLVRNLFYIYKMWTLDVDPTKKEQETLRVLINQTERNINRKQSLSMDASNLQQELAAYKEALQKLQTN